MQDFEQFDEDEAEAAGYIDPSAPQKEEDEIEMVLGHTRDEEHKEDSENDRASALHSQLHNGTDPRIY